MAIGDKKKPGGLTVAIGVGPAPKGEKPAMEPEMPAEAEAEEDPKALAGTALAKALKSGDGAAVAAAFEELLAVLDEADMPEEAPAEFGEDDADMGLT